MSPLNITIPPELQVLAVALQAVIEHVTEVRRGALNSEPLNYMHVERQLAQDANALERAAHQVVLEALDIDAPRLLINGQPYRRVHRTPGKYYTQAGKVKVKRTLYRKEGERQGPTVDPVSLRAQVVGRGWLPQTAKAMAFECQRSPSREAQASCQQMFRLPYSRSSFERTARRVGQKYDEERCVIERDLVDSWELPPEAHSVSASLDRVNVPMEKPREPEEPKPGQKAPKRPVQRVFEQGYVATVTVHDSKGEALETLRYGRMPGADVEGLCMGVGDDVARLVERHPDLKVVELCDGAPELWNRLDKELKPEDLGRPVERLIDYWHVVEKLGEAAQVLESADGRKDRLVGWRWQLLTQETAAAEILKELESSGQRQVQVGEKQPVHAAMTYLENHPKQMNYAKARQQGLPIGSGNVEATCKSLFEVRLKRSGCRWKTQTGQPIVDLRALALSDRWEEAMELLLGKRQVEVKPLGGQAQFACA